MKIAVLFLFCYFTVTINIAQKNDGFTRFYSATQDSVGLKNSAGKIVIPCIYEYISKIKGEFGMALEYDTAHSYHTATSIIFDTLGNIITHKKYMSILGFQENDSGFSNGLVPVSVEMKTASCFGGDYFWDLEELYGYINNQGKEVIPCQFYHAGKFENGIARVNFHGIYQYIDTTGKIVRLTPPAGVYQSIGEFSEYVAVVQDSQNYWGYIDTLGNEIIRCNFENAKKMKNGLAPVKVNGKWGFIDKAGNLAISPIYDDADEFDGTLAKVARQHRFGYINFKGEEIVPCVFNSALAFSEETGIVSNYHETIFLRTMPQPSNDDTCFFFDNNGHLIRKIKVPIYFIDTYGDSLSYLDTGVQAIFVDHKGNTSIVISDSLRGTRKNYFERIGFHDSRLKIMCNLHEGFVDKTGKIVIPCQWDYAEDFHNGFAIVGMDDMHPYRDHGDFKTYYKCVIDPNGRVITEKSYMQIYPFSNGLAMVSSNYDEFMESDMLGDPKQVKFGYINTLGKMVIPEIYEKAGNFGNGLAAVKYEGHWRIIDTTGKCIKQLK